MQIDISLYLHALLMVSQTELFFCFDLDKKRFSRVCSQVLGLMFIVTPTTYHIMSSCKLKYIKVGTDRSGHGRREGAIVHVGGVVHVAHHDVAWVARVRMAFTVHVLEFS